MGVAQAEHEFNWVTNAEPHATRRREILDKYGPQVRALYGYDNWTAVQVASLPNCANGSVFRARRGEKLIQEVPRVRL